MKNKAIPNIITYIGIGLVTLLAIGLISSLFAGNSGGGDGVIVPSVNRPSVETPEGTEAPSVPETPEDPSVPVKAAADQSKFNIYVGPEDLSSILDFEFSGNKLSAGVGDHQVVTDTNGTSFLRVYGDGSSQEAYAVVENIEGKTTGKYLVFAYRLPTSNIVSSSIQIFARTCDGSLTEEDAFMVSAEKDGEWHVCVIDIEEAIASSIPEIVKFKANEDGTYSIHRFRIDWFNDAASTDDYIDIAYVGICDDPDKAISADPDYTLAEFTAQELSKLSNFSNTLLNDNGMEYVNFRASVPSNGEITQYLYKSESAFSGASRYVAVMYKNATDHYCDLHINSAETLTESLWHSAASFYYTLDDKWHLGVIELPNYSNTFFRSLRIDFGNGLTDGTLVSVDVAFIKFFSSKEEANAYFQNCIETYDLNAE